MRFAFSSNAFRNFSLRDTVSIISRAGYDGIEIMCDIPHAYPARFSASERAETMAFLKQNNLEISNLNAFMMCAVQDFHHPSWIEPDKDFRQIRIQYTLDCLDLASELGAKSISTEPGGPLAAMDYNTGLKLFVDGLTEAIPAARARGIQILVEPEPDLLLENSAQFLAFMDKVGNEDVVGLNFDIGHFFCVGEDPVRKILELRDHIQHFHLEDIPSDRRHEHVMLGEGALNIPKILETIEKIGYEGFITVELYPYQDSAEATAYQAREYLRRVCGYE